MITLYTGRNGMEMWQASIAFQADPSPENKARLDAINERMAKEHKLMMRIREDKFLKLYGQEMLDFIKSLGEVPSDPRYGSWQISSDDNDDYWLIKFYEGKFFYVKEICGGYAGTEYLEEDISKERVLELLKK